MRRKVLDIDTQKSYNCKVVVAHIQAITGVRVKYISNTLFG